METKVDPETGKKVELFGLHPCMRKVLRTAEQIWINHGRSEGVTVTSTVDGVHSAGSWHPYGFATDLRTKYWDKEEQKEVYNELRDALPEYDIIMHNTHIHAEIGNPLAEKLGVLF